MVRKLREFLLRYWWVNQNRTYRQEVGGGYLWSPKRKKGGYINPFYEFMREVKPGDVIFSFAGRLVKAIGVARSYTYEAPKPLEFGAAGAQWDKIGWRVDVAFYELKHKIRPADYMDRIAPLLPSRYSPLRVDGRGNELYLTQLSEALAAELSDLIGHEARVLISDRRIATEVSSAIGLVQWEEHQLAAVRADESVPETTREAVVLARRGQGLFKQRVQMVEHRCRLTGVDRIEHLRASHCKPWRDADNGERLDGENGLLLTPDADHLFDRGFLTFENSGTVLISPVAHIPSLCAMGLDPKSLENVGGFSERQRGYLAFHRENVFLQARVRLG